MPLPIPKPRKLPFAGTEYIEKRYFDLQPSLATVYLDGLESRNEKLGIKGMGVSNDYAEQAIRRGMDYLSWLRGMKVPKKVQPFVERKMRDVESLLNRAIEVQMGRQWPLKASANAQQRW